MYYTLSVSIENGIAVLDHYLVMTVSICYMVYSCTMSTACISACKITRANVYISRYLWEWGTCSFIVVESTSVNWNIIWVVKLNPWIIHRATSLLMDTFNGNILAGNELYSTNIITHFIFFATRRVISSVYHHQPSSFCPLSESCTV